MITVLLNFTRKQTHERNLNLDRGQKNSAEGGLRGTELVSAELLSAVESKGRTITYAIPVSDELRYLDYWRANANVGGENMTDILLRQNPRKIEVLKEFLHGARKRIGLIDKIGVDAAEIHVKEFMRRNQKPFPFRLKTWKYSNKC